MPGCHLQLIFKAEWIIATINDAEGRLSKYIYDNHDVQLIQSIIQGTYRIEDLEMFKEQLENFSMERIFDFMFSMQYGTNLDI